MCHSREPITAIGEATVGLRSEIGVSNFVEPTFAARIPHLLGIHRPATDYCPPLTTSYSTPRTDLGCYFGNALAA